MEIYAYSWMANRDTVLGAVFFGNVFRHTGFDAGAATCC